MEVTSPAFTKEQIESEGYQFVKEIPGRGFCGLMRLFYTVGLFYNIDEYSYEGRYCFHTAYDALLALHMWDGKNDPPGNWIKHKGGLSEYRNPDYENDRA